MGARVLLLLVAALVDSASAGWCDSRSTGQHCRQDASTNGQWAVQMCECRREQRWENTYGSYGRRSLAEESEDEPDSIYARADKGHGDKLGDHAHAESSVSRVHKGRRRTSASRRRSGGSTAAAVGTGVVVGAAMSSSYSSRSRRRSQRLVEYWDCDSRGPPTPCQYGCTNGYCTIPPADQVCGTAWAPALRPDGLDARTATCPSVTWTSWKSIMQSSTIILNNLDGVDSDQSWFEGLMETYLYAPTENTTQVTTSAAGDVSVALPLSLDELSQRNQPVYNLFTCSRRLPKCVNDDPEPTECIQRCRDISDKIAEFTEACVAFADQVSFASLSLCLSASLPLCLSLSLSASLPLCLSASVSLSLSLSLTF